MNNSLLARVAQIRDGASATRRAILEAILADPDRVLEESFEQLAERSGSSVPTIMQFSTGNSLSERKSTVRWASA